ncbi:MAG: hypothetical protein GYB67_15740 [Chloroflexi bacterium]|nr:hypothetical protein [Chloroflexota bacterium]
MDRTVPKTGSEEIELYMRTYYSLLRSSHMIQLETLVETHMAMDSSLHVQSSSPEPDVSALVYTSLRLPPCMPNVDVVILGQSEKSFLGAGYAVTQWERTYASGRRRRMHFDGQHILAAFIVSRSDIDDLIPMLTAYQIEWNKLNALLQGEVTKLFLSQHRDRKSPLTEAEVAMLSGALRLEADDLGRLAQAWGEQFVANLTAISRERKQIGVRLIAGSQADYRRATAQWWDELHAQLPDSVGLGERPVYFVSSNTHSLVNLLTGYALREEQRLINYIEARGHEALLAEYRQMQQQETNTTRKNNFLYYVLKKYLQDSDRSIRDQLRANEWEIGIHRVSSRHGFDLETQVIEINKLRSDWLDPRLCDERDYEFVHQSDALIVNIDYPLGLGAYELLARLTEGVQRVLGIYVMGKAATLNGRIGDVTISNVVHDEHSQNTYLFNNCFSAQDIAPYLTYGMVLDNQKAISARGTFLQNSRYMSVFYHEGYTVIEMEAGPYLSSVYEAVRPQRHPYNEIVNLYSAPFEVGVLHYASDTPLKPGENLGARSLSYTGVDPTYATAIAILKRILEREVGRMRQRLPINQRGSEHLMSAADSAAGLN